MQATQWVGGFLADVDSKRRGTFPHNHHEPFPLPTPISPTAAMNPAHDPSRWAAMFAYWQKHGAWDGARCEEHLDALNGAMIAAAPGVFDVDAFLSARLAPPASAPAASSAEPVHAQDPESRIAQSTPPANPPAPLPPAAASPDATSPLYTPTSSSASLPLSGSTPATTPAQPTPAAANNHLRTPKPPKAPLITTAPTHPSPLRETTTAAAGLSLKRKRVPASEESLPPAKRAAVPVNAVQSTSQIAGPSSQHARASHWHQLVHRGAPSSAVANGATGSSMFTAPAATPVSASHSSQHTQSYGPQAPQTSQPAAGPSQRRPPPDKGPDHLRAPAGNKRVKTKDFAPIGKDFYCDVCHQAYERDVYWYTSQGLTRHMKTHQ
ncbi:hypothetical protein AURDEDRAFT_130173 [Auricularia subglabra TFB-10046 SS5]|uniref:Uncharacterized protein n=1 Tax=Auricularia subglabra (strain TFB-10046 / SS5) TaxID=717982 RepID=J0WSQ1_AURST|nr:hypothetical protein AURDEDRAFT_130173 [Auricularia subglabra TFB-10046 SS5]